MQQDTFVKERTALAAQPEQGEDTIDLLELFMGLLAHWTLIAATAVVGAVLMALYTFFLVTPMYKATATIYVVSRNDSVLNFSDLQVGSELTSDYIKVFEMWEVHEKVISNLDLDYTYTDMASMLSVTNTSDTRMLDITVTNPDPEEAAAIANEYADVGAKYISEKMKTDEPTLMSSARVPENPFSPNKAKNILLGFVVVHIAFVRLEGGDKAALHELCKDRLQRSVRRRAEQLAGLLEVLAVAADIGFAHAGSHVEVELRHALAAVLVVLVGGCV